MNTDYSEYRDFLEYFKKNTDPNDALPFRVGGYELSEKEVTGEVIDWTMQYLNEQKCPPSLAVPIIKEVIKETKNSCTKSPTTCGFDGKFYQPLKLMPVVFMHLREVCSRLSENKQLDEILPKKTVHPKYMPKYVSKAIKNTRRKMEDRHVCIEDFHGLFGIEDTEPTSFYGVFDGHGGQDAASYCVSQLHQNIATSLKYPKHIEEAIRDAFLYTDLKFLEKAEKQNLMSGSTVVCLIYRMLEKTLYVAWVGDSQALLVRQARVCQLVNSHKPERPCEKERIEKLNGCVLCWGGMYRVNGQLAVSRAIGDSQQKPWVTGEPEITKIALDGEEDFLVIASDGLWESMTEDNIAVTVYKMLRKNPDNLDAITQTLVETAKKNSSDNITVIVVFLRDPHLIAKSSWLDKMEAFENSTTNGTAFGNVTQDIFQKENNLLDLVDNDMNITKLSTIAPTTNDFIETPSPIEEEEETNANNWTEQPHQTYNDNQQFMAEEEEEALEKPQNEIDFMTSNLVEHMKTDESDMSEVSNRIFVDDFGPETDVDGGDDGALKTPMEHEVLEEEEEEDEDGVVVEECNNEEVDFAGHEEPQMMTGNNPFSLENKIIEELSMQNGDFLKETNPFGNVDHHHLMDPTAPIIDNKIIDELESYGTNSVAEKAIDHNEVECASDFETIEPEHTKKQEIIDFSEKRDFSFEKELTMDTTAEEIHDFVKHEIGSGEEDFDSMQPEEKIDQAATTLVEESAGEDSEDEWNYIKVKEQEQQKQQEAIEASETNHIESVESEKIESELEGGDNVKESEFVEEKQPQELFEHEAENIQEEGICLEEEIKEEEAGRLEREEIKEEQEKVEELVTEEDHFDENKENIFEPVEQIERAIEVPVFESVRPVEPEPIIEESLFEPYTDEVEEKIEQEEVKFETELHFEPEAVEEEEEDEEDIEEVQSHPHKEELVEEEIKEQESVKEEEDQDQIEESDDQPNSLENQMASQLNPEAKEFVPISPIRSDPTSPINTMAPVNPQLNLPDDSVISQSPRKGASATLDIANLPSENEFDIEISKRPHELEEPEKVNGENGHSRSSSSGPSFQEMNLKEAMHGDEKLEYEYNDEKQVPAEDLSPDGSSNTHLLEQLNREEDPMNRSFYAGRDENILSGDDSELNKVQDLPDDIIADEEEDHQVTQQNGGGDYFNDEISKPEEDMYSPVTEQPKVEEFLVTTESDKPESELLLQEEVVAPIVEAASHVASEITTLINEIQIAEKPAEIMECNLAPIMDQMSQFFEKAPEMPETELAGSLSEAENLVSREITEESAESDKCLQNDNLIDVDDQLKESVPECDVPPPTPAVVTGESFSHPVIMPELSESPIREDVESPVTATPVDEPVIVPEHIETVAIEQKKDEIEEKKVEEIVQQTVEIVPEVVAVAAATVAAATVAAVAATTKKPAAKPTDKKPATGKTVPAKPASAPVKTASKTVAAAPPKKTSAPVTKAAPAKPASPPKPISKPSTTSTTAAKPKPAVTAPTRPAVERKPLTSTLAAKKPADIKKPSSADAKKPALAVNGEAKKPIANGDAKSPIVKKTAPLKTTVAPTKTAPAKPAVPKPAVSATKTMTVTKTSSVSKSPITKPATARVPSSTTTSTVTAKTSTARAPLSSVTKTEVKPRVTTSTTNKAPTSATARMSVTNTTAPKTSLAVKKTMSTDKTSPTSKTVSKTSTTTVKSSTVGAARTTTTTTKTSTNVIKKSASPIKKPSAGTAKPTGPITRPVDKSKTPSKEPVEATTTLTNGHSENGHLENHETNEQKMNHLNLEHDSNLLIDTSDPPQQQMIVIDSAAD